MSLLPDASQLWPRDHIVAFDGTSVQTRWVAWLALMHVSVFGLCLMGALGKASRARSIMLVATGVWFLLQGVDEVLMGNFFRSGLIEYPILVVYWVGTILYIKRYDHATR